MRRRGLDIPFDRDGSGRFLPWLIALMVYLAALATSGALALDRALARWDTGLAGTLTVELPPDASSGTGKGSLAAAVRTIAATPGVRSARPLTRADMGKLLAPWLGPDLPPDELALPQLIDVRIDLAHGVDLAAMRAALAKAAPDAVLDDHRLWLGRLAALIRTAEATAIVIVALIGAAAVLTVIFTTRTGLSVHRDVIELLHLMGARDGYIAAQFQRQALRLGLGGSLVGLALALATLLALVHAGAAAAVLGERALPLPTVNLVAFDWALLCVLPAVAAALAMVTARLTVLRALSRMP
ncbi:MAG TPA: FtsX-like permease family protein [Stellaceae bacterium]|nr:FtsX-like permease family protein [Stellaceae bacterium]